MKNNKGFTLVETMLTVTIIGVLSALAIPAYQDYSIKSQVVDAFTATEALKKEIEEQKALTDRFDKSLITLNSDILQTNEDGHISYIFKNKNKKINNRLVMFILDDSNTSSYKWNCITDLPKKYLPINCIVDYGSGEENTSNIYDTELLFSSDYINHSITFDYNYLYFRFISEHGMLTINDDEVFFESNNNENLNFTTKYSNKNELFDIIFKNKFVGNKSLKGFISNTPDDFKENFQSDLNINIQNACISNSNRNICV